MTVWAVYVVETISEMPFVYLTCDLPPPPLYPDDMRENIIPQVPIFNILNKFNGIQEKEYKTYKDSTMRKFQLTRLPPYILLYFKVKYNFVNVNKNYLTFFFQLFFKVVV